MERTTIKNIAEQAGVSITTVSCVLNGREMRISNATKKKVIKIANELDYHPNQLAVGLITKKTNTIGLIIPDISNTFFGELAKGAENRAAELGYNVFLCNTNDSTEKDLDYLRALLDRGVDGVILVPSGRGKDEKSPECFKLLDSCQKSFVILDRTKTGDKYLGISLDHKGGGFIATDYLIKNGHKKIGCITGPLGMLNSYRRYQGYVEALSKAGIKYDDHLVKEGNYHISDGVELAESLFRKKVTAIFACNDLMAFGVYQAARKRGLRIPEDLSIVGFDDITYSEFMEVPLTTIRQPALEMGKCAVEKVVEMINNPDYKRDKIIFEPKLIERNSVKNIGGDTDGSKERA